MARRAPRRDRRRHGRARGRPPPGDGGHRPAEPADPALAHRRAEPGLHRQARGARQPVHRRAGQSHQGRDGHPRRAVLGAGRAGGHLSRPLRRAGRRRAGGMAATLRCQHGRPCGVDRIVGGDGSARVGGRAADVRTGREDRHSRRHRKGVQRVARHRPRPGGRRRRPDGQHRHQARPARFR